MYHFLLPITASLSSTHNWVRQQRNFFVERCIMYLENELCDNKTQYSEVVNRSGDKAMFNDIFCQMKYHAFGQ